MQKNFLALRASASRYAAALRATCRQECTSILGQVIFSGWHAESESRKGGENTGEHSKKFAVLSFPSPISEEMGPERPFAVGEHGRDMLLLGKDEPHELPALVRGLHAAVLLPLCFPRTFQEWGRLRRYKVPCGQGRCFGGQRVII